MPRSEAAVRGFLLQPTYRVEGGRAVVHLFGRLESGESFLVRDRRPVPCFWIRLADGERALSLGARRLIDSDRVSLAGEPLLRVEFTLPSDAPPLRDRLQTAGVPCYEADVRFAFRYLIDRGIRGAVSIRGPWHAGAGVARVYDEPELTPADWSPRLSVLSFDLETNVRSGGVLSAALYGAGVAEVLMLAPDPPGEQSEPPGVTSCATEGELLATFCRRVRELDPDVLTGWNIVDFDLPVLVQASERWGGFLELGRGPGGVRLSGTPGRGRFARGTATVPGRAVLDGLRLMRGAAIRRESYALDAVAREVLGEGKIASAGEGGEEVLRMFREDRAGLAAYNLADARLALGVVEKLQLVELAVERSRLTGLPPERLGSSIAAFDFLYLSALGRRGIAAPTAGAPDADIDLSEPAGGGHVFDPQPGLHAQVIVFDFRSLYPSVIRTFGIDPLLYVAAPGPADDVVVAPNGAAFRREPAGILPALLDELFPIRQAAQARGDRVAAYAVKILMNSFYGVLGTSACRFHNPRVANAITAFGRALLLETRRRIEERGLVVLYGDTDSLFVASGVTTTAAAQALGERLTRELTAELAEWIERRYRVTSRLTLELQVVYAKLLLPAARGGAGGARKRYAGWIESPDGPGRAVFVGLEVVRRDWTELARRAQREVYERLFTDRPLESYLVDLVADLLAGRLDELLVYHKGLRKDPRAYTATTPPHVAAARKLAGAAAGAPPGVMAYVMTTAGPEPAAEQRHPFDYEHYLEKQLKPVAAPVLELLGQDFDAVVGRRRQMGLF